MERDARMAQEVEKIRLEQEYQDFTARKAAEQRMIDQQLLEERLAR